MSRSLAIVMLVGLATVFPATPIGAADEADKNLWSAAGVTHFAERKEAPNFILNDLDGKPVSLAEQRGRLVMLYFWATW